MTAGAFPFLGFLEAGGPDRRRGGAFEVCRNTGGIDTGLEAVVGGDGEGCLEGEGGAAGRDKAGEGRREGRVIGWMVGGSDAWAEKTVLVDVPKETEDAVPVGVVSRKEGTDEGVKMANTGAEVDKRDGKGGGPVLGLSSTISKIDSSREEVSAAFLLSLVTRGGRAGVPWQSCCLWHVVWKTDLHAKHLSGFAGFLSGFLQ